MTDPGFPVGDVDPLGGCRPPMRALLGENVCENERIGSHTGGMRRAPPRSANALTSKAVHYILLNIFSINPKIWCDSYKELQQTMGYIHNACAVMLFFCYFLLKHPKLPDFKGVIKFYRLVKF